MTDKTQTYDFVVSLGEDCACSAYLRKNGLQVFSYPFDWLTNADFETRIDLLTNDFKDFMNISDLKIMEKPDGGSADKHSDYYENKKNGFYFYHDFPEGVPLAGSFPNVSEKYARRIKRLYDSIDRAKRVLFVWFSRFHPASERQIGEAFRRISEKFPGKDFCLLALENDERKDGIERMSFLDDKAVKYVYNMYGTNGPTALDAVMGNQEKGNAVFRRFKLRLPLSLKLKLFLQKLAVKFIPFKQLRRRKRKQLLEG